MMFVKPKNPLLVLTAVGLVVVLTNTASLVGGFFIGRSDAFNSGMKFSSTRNRQLVLVEESDYLVNQTLSKLIRDMPDVSLIRVALIQTNSPVAGKGQIPLLRFDVTHAITAAHTSAPTMQSNLPLSQWNAYLPNMIEGKCTVIYTPDLSDDQEKQRLMSAGIDTLVACPLRDRNRELIGGVFASWSNKPSADVLQRSTALLQTAAARIVGYLEIRIDGRGPA